MDDNADIDADVAVEDLLRYADRQGVRLNGIAPRRLPGRGFGIVATRALRPDDVVLEVPTRALRTLTTVPKAVSRRLAGAVSVHGILAADLLLDGAGGRAGAVPRILSYGPHSAYAAWNAVLPTRADLAAGMPLLWPAALQALLPSAARAALGRQRAKLQRDWAGAAAVVVGAAAPAGGDDVAAAAEAAYTRAWLLVNSRTFYYTTPRTEAALPSRDDRMAMQPVADLFNHAADVGCRVAYTAGGFAFAADRAYAAGAEVPISYGAHGNDALLVEYGFLLAANAWDEVALDEVVCPRLARAARADLDAAGFPGGGYMVDAATPGGCYRTQVALRRVLCGSDARRVAAWRRFVEGGADDGGGGGGHNIRDGDDDDDGDQAAVDALLLVCLDEMAALARARLAAIRRLGEGEGEGDDDDDYEATAGKSPRPPQPPRKGRHGAGSSRDANRREQRQRGPVGSEAQRRLLAQRWHEIEATVARAAEQLRAAKGER